MRNRVEVMHGVNFDALGRRDPEQYGGLTLTELEVRVKRFARDIAEKYVAPPMTTDFAIMFLPTEGLFAEVLRRPGEVPPHPAPGDVLAPAG